MMNENNEVLIEKTEITDGQTTSTDKGNESNETKTEVEVSESETNLDTESDEEADFSDTSEEEQTETLDKDKAKQEPNKEKNSKFAQQRREKEAREKEIEEIKQKAYTQALVDSVNGVNPYTGDKIEDEHDIQEYLTMREIEKKGLDPISDYHKYLKDKAREEKNKTNIAKTPPLTNEQIQEDAKLFRTKYPNVSINDLQNDARFLKFSDGKLGTQTLTKVYGDYQDFVKEFDVEVDKKARRLLAKSKSSPGAVETATPSVDSDFFTIEQIKQMSQKEISQNFEKVEKSMQNYYKTNK